MSLSHQPLAVVAALAALLLGCGSVREATLAQLQRRAEFDTGCPAIHLRVWHLDAHTKAVVGCGWRLVYVQSCQPTRGGTSCTWLANTPGMPARPAAVAPVGSWPVASAPAPGTTRSTASGTPPGPAAAGWRPVAEGPATQGSSTQPGHGKLNVASDGGYCVVTINGMSHGFTPVAGVAVPAGTALVSCHAPNGTVIQRAVVITAGQTSRIRFRIPARELVDVSTPQAPPSP